jgi:Multiubiquitin
MSEEHSEKPQKHEVRIHIDEEPYRSPNPTTGEALYRLADIPAHHELYRELGGDREDEPVRNSADPVHLKEDEHFHSGPKEVAIFVNTRKKEVAARRLTYDQVVALAFNPVPSGPNIMFTITYRNGPKANPEGELLPNGKVRIKDRMIFDVTQTDKS